MLHIFLTFFDSHYFLKWCSNFEDALSKWTLWQPWWLKRYNRNLYTQSKFTGQKTYKSHLCAVSEPSKEFLWISHLLHQANDTNPILCFVLETTGHKPLTNRGHPVHLLIAEPSSKVSEPSWGISILKMKPSWNRADNMYIKYNQIPQFCSCNMILINFMVIYVN